MQLAAHLEAHAQRLEAGPSRRGDERGSNRAQPARTARAPAAPVSQPSIAGRSGLRRGRGELEVRAHPGIPHRVPAETERARIVNQQHAGCAVALGLLDLVGPAPVGAQREALEDARDRGCRSPDRRAARAPSCRAHRRPRSRPSGIRAPRCRSRRTRARSERAPPSVRCAASTGPCPCLDAAAARRPVPGDGERRIRARRGSRPEAPVGHNSRRCRASGRTCETARSEIDRLLPARRPGPAALEIIRGERTQVRAKPHLLEIERRTSDAGHAVRSPRALRRGNRRKSAPQSRCRMESLFLGESGGRASIRRGAASTTG